MDKYQKILEQLDFAHFSLLNRAISASEKKYVASPSALNKALYKYSIAVFYIDELRYRLASEIIESPKSEQIILQNNLDTIKEYKSRLYKWRQLANREFQS